MFAAGSGNNGADAAEEDASTFSVKRSDSLLSNARDSGDNESSSSGDAGPRALPGSDPESVLRFGWSEYFRRVFRFLFWHKLMVLLVFVPIAMICHVSNANQGVIFATCMLGLIPLASMLGDITEQLALHTNETVGGLLNATFGNATEAIVSIFAIRSGQIRLVQVSLVGSVLSNLLLVLGSAFLAGGIKYKVQLMKTDVAVTNTGLLFFVAVCLSIVSLMKMGNAFNAGGLASELALSRFISVLMLAAYGLYLYFQLKTHAHMFNDDDDEDEEGGAEVAEGAATEEAGSAHDSEPVALPSSDPADDADLSYMSSDAIEMRVMVDGTEAPAASASKTAKGHSSALANEDGKSEGEKEGAEAEEEDDDDEDEEKILGPWGGIVAMFIATVFIAILSEEIVDAVDGASRSLNIPAIFIGTILLPIVGNAAEHASALTVAYKGKINLAIGVAVGSSIQIALFVIPFMTLIAAASGQAMSLDFHLLEVASIFLSVALVGFMLSDGKATWLKGAMLVFIYLIIAAAFYYHVDD